MNLSIIVPLYNEATEIVGVLEKIRRVNMSEFVSSTEIIVVDDCSTDGSDEKVRNYPNNDHLFFFRHDKNMGKGAAVRTGLSHAHGDVYLIQDADGELCPDDIPSMLIAMHDLGVEFVNGSRYMPGICRPLSSYKRYLGNKFFTILTSTFINVKLTDMTCGYKLFNKHIYDQLTLHENRFGFEAELIIKALRIKRNNIAEVPVQYFPRNEGEGKKLKGSDTLKILWTTLKYGLLRLN